MTEVMLRSDMEYEKRGRYITGPDRIESPSYSIMNPIVSEDVEGCNF
jgi:hypothetical protein